jgi:hypothetical protein
MRINFEDGENLVSDKSRHLEDHHLLVSRNRPRIYIGYMNTVRCAKSSGRTRRTVIMIMLLLQPPAIATRLEIYGKNLLMFNLDAVTHT